jgi:hypothetical protein
VSLLMSPVSVNSFRVLMICLRLSGSFSNILFNFLSDYILEFLKLGMVFFYLIHFSSVQKIR